MAERDSGNPEGPNQAFDQLVEAVFGGQPYHYTANGAGLYSASRRTPSVPVGEPNFEDYGTPFQPTLSAEDNRAYWISDRLPLIKRTLGRLVMPKQEYLKALIEPAEPSSQAIYIHYIARRVTTSQISGFFDGLSVTLRRDRFSSSDIHCGLLHDDFENPDISAKYIARYKEELTGILEASEEQLLAAITAHLTSAPEEQ